MKLADEVRRRHLRLKFVYEMDGTGLCPGSLLPARPQQADIVRIFCKDIMMNAGRGRRFLMGETTE
jgi:hypothetical protein